MAHRIGIIGLGKIAHDQHVPVIRANPAAGVAPAAELRSDLDGLLSTAVARRR